MMCQGKWFIMSGIRTLKPKKQKKTFKNYKYEKLKTLKPKNLKTFSKNLGFSSPAYRFRPNFSPDGLSLQYR